ncbi:flagellar hook-associated protein FlgK [Neobacillus niacini]|uniref:flagellar hook-associated protein FlgK n=1 Tax=Neobacillus niacini TaxID=86668 RepID=UPI00285A647E|nr:flagellar hook-associated protein FlgK [Neobacillus niacini]MDR7000977.1 flagellar hook-associated protein 1 FlgK [Neobacillus niacini]
MTSTFHGIELGKRALFAQQTALSVTGQNVSNANTTGYTRQRAEMQDDKGLSLPGANGNNMQLGTGVVVNKLVRLREDYLDVQYRGENQNLGYWDAKSDTLSKIEGILNEPSDTGLASTMDQFWSSWQELSKNPDSAAARAVVRQRGVAVAETFHYLSDSLDQMKDDTLHVIDAKVKSVNDIVDQIGNLNKQISSLVANNYQPNDLYDQRDVLIDNLSKIVNVSVTNHSNGLVDVAIGTDFLVKGIDVNKLEGFDLSNGLKYPENITLNGNPLQLNSGELKGRIESYQKTIPEMHNKIDTLAKTFADSINKIHSSGYHLQNSGGTFNAVSPSDDFFKGIDPITGNILDPTKVDISAKNIEINPAIMDSLDLIAAANEGITGNGQNAQAIANLKFTGNLDFNGTTSTIDDYYRNIIGQLGIDSQEAQRMQGNSDVIVNQIDNRRQSVSGVSLDEEMANMIKYQQAYNAAARMVTTMDQCLDKIINGMGRVGL